jgi:hypothetical protein
MTFKRRGETKLCQNRQKFRCDNNGTKPQNQRTTGSRCLFRFFPTAHPASRNAHSKGRHSLVQTAAPALHSNIDGEDFIGIASGHRLKTKPLIKRFRFHSKTGLLKEDARGVVGALKKGGKEVAQNCHADGNGAWTF